MFAALMGLLLGGWLPARQAMRLQVATRCAGGRAKKRRGNRRAGPISANWNRCVSPEARSRREGACSSRFVWRCSRSPFWAWRPTLLTPSDGKPLEVQTALVTLIAAESRENPLQLAWPSVIARHEALHHDRHQDLWE